MASRVIGGPGYSGPAVNIADKKCRECAEWRDNPGRCLFWKCPAARKQAACIAFKHRED